MTLFSTPAVAAATTATAATPSKSGDVERRTFAAATPTQSEPASQ
jgi:hypothetical protein